MNILINNAGFRNKGAEAMLRTVQRELSLRLPDVTFYAMVTPREVHLALESGFIPVTDQWLTPLLFNFFRRVARVSRCLPDTLCIAFNRCVFSIPPYLYTRRKSKQGIDALIDISGYSYHDEGVERIINVLSGIRSSDKMIYKNYFMPQAWGKFTNMASKYWIKKLHAQSTLFYARDEISFTYLRDSCIDVQNIRRAPDIAFLFRGSDIAVGAAILSKRGFPPPHRPMIGVVPNVRVYERTAGRGTGNDYLKVLEALVRFSIEKLDVNVVLLPNDCMLPGDNHTDDRFLCSLLYSRLDCADRVLVLTDDHRAEEIKAIIGNLDFLISSRFHSLVFALSQSVPVLALGWSHKYPELLSLFGLERYLISHETIHMHNSLDLLQSAWREKDILSEKIQRVLPQIESAARKVFDDVAESLCA